MLVSDSEKKSEENKKIRPNENDNKIIRHADYDKESKTFYTNFYFFRKVKNYDK